MATATAMSSAEEPKEVATATTSRSDGRRRTERVRREKPNYYDASVFIRKTRVIKFLYFIVKFLNKLNIIDNSLSLIVPLDILKCYNSN